MSVKAKERGEQERQSGTLLSGQGRSSSVEVWYSKEAVRFREEGWWWVASKLTSRKSFHFPLDHLRWLINLTFFPHQLLSSQVAIPRLVYVCEACQSCACPAIWLGCRRLEADFMSSKTFVDFNGQERDQCGWLHRMLRIEWHLMDWQGVKVFGLGNLCDEKPSRDSLMPKLSLRTCFLARRKPA